MPGEVCAGRDESGIEPAYRILSAGIHSEVTPDVYTVNLFEMVMFFSGENDVFC